MRRHSHKGFILENDVRLAIACFRPHIKHQVRPRKRATINVTKFFGLASEEVRGCRTVCSLGVPTFGAWQYFIPPMISVGPPLYVPASPHFDELYICAQYLVATSKIDPPSNIYRFHLHYLILIAMSNSTKNDYSASATSDHSESEAELAPRRESRSRRSRNRTQNRQNPIQNPLGGALDPVSNVTNQVLDTTNQVGDLAQNTVGNAVGGVGNAAGGAVGAVGNTASSATGQKGKNKDALSLRLDLNLDIEVTLKARIHGDLTLALLYVTRTIVSASYPVLLPSSPPLYRKLWTQMPCNHHTMISSSMALTRTKHMKLETRS